VSWRVSIVVFAIAGLLATAPCVSAALACTYGADCRSQTEALAADCCALQAPAADPARFTMTRPPALTADVLPGPAAVVLAGARNNSAPTDRTAVGPSTPFYTLHSALLL
jgi:hypothetical protein